MRRLAASLGPALAGLALSSCAHTTEAPANQGTTYAVYFMGGQSNMEGAGFSDELPYHLREAQPDVPLFHGRMREDGQDGGGIGVWSATGPGHGFGFDTDGTANRLSNRFGPEISFAYTLTTQRPGQHVAIIKYARGGTGLIDGVSGYGSWDPDYATGNGRNQYDNALTAIEQAMQPRDIDGDGHIDTLIPAGIIWMQGEADAADNQEAADNYARNLARLMFLLRDALDNEVLPVVIGRIQDSGDTPDTRVMRFSPTVQAQQAEFVGADECAALVTVTQDFTFPADDPWHYTSDDYVTLGTAFAMAAIELEETCY